MMGGIDRGGLRNVELGFSTILLPWLGEVTEYDISEHAE
jgi:hypothetical protein